MTRSLHKGSFLVVEGDTDARVYKKFINKEECKIIPALAKQDHDPWQVCCGHDMVKILAFWLRHIFGNKNAQNVTAEILESTLRLTYSIEDFKTTQLYGAIMDWQQTNPPYLILVED